MRAEAFLIRRHRRQAISTIAIDVTVPWFVCLPVCPSVTFVHCAQTAEDIDTISLAYNNPHVSLRSCYNLPYDS